ncbi:energy-coupling factor transport system substrate-specific component [Halomicrobium zhouii]|uniref:Energy-coupling factor transport system substrate-specific component n=1 Tax=Halomicrobium zhouii TaxID=767519 RepID=A0A1I6M8X1_9EURY|nr:QueT transporter family protein [Halomicrobium zhouii]SFS12101.1 energy-coupling factor transport system substrate-specific component [Halomicrobium zhouii]
MRELITMWRDTRMIMLVAVIAAIYAAVLIPFNALTIIPGITSIRPANVFPVIFGIMFGPAAAWGSAVGNLIGDVFSGQLGPGSLGGFLGNFFFGLVGYKLWGNLGPLSSGEEPRMDSARQVVEYLVIALTAAAACAAIIAWWLDVLELFPFSVLGTIITVNNFLAAAVLGPPLLYLVYPRVKEMGLLYPDVMREEDLPEVAPSRRQLAATGIVVVSIVWVAVGIAISVGVEGTQFLATTGETFGQGGSVTQQVLGAVGLLVLLGLTAISGDSLSEMVRR